MCGSNGLSKNGRGDREDVAENFTFFHNNDVHLYR